MIAQHCLALQTLDICMHWLANVSIPLTLNVHRHLSHLYAHTRSRTQRAFGSRMVFVCAIVYTISLLINVRKPPSHSLGSCTL